MYIDIADFWMIYISCSMCSIHIPTRTLEIALDPAPWSTAARRGSSRDLVATHIAIGHAGFLYGIIWCHVLLYYFLYGVICFLMFYF